MILYFRYKQSSKDVGARDRVLAKFNGGAGSRGVKEAGGAAAPQDNFAETVSVTGGAGRESQFTFRNTEDSIRDQGGFLDLINFNFDFRSGFEGEGGRADSGFEVAVAVNPGNFSVGYFRDGMDIDFLGEHIFPP